MVFLKYSLEAKKENRAKSKSSSPEILSAQKLRKEV
jgi:hypothetical protein